MDVTGAKLRKSQKKAIKSFNKYVTTGVKPKNVNNDPSKQGESQGGEDGMSHSKVEMMETPNLKFDRSSKELISKLDTSSESIKGIQKNCLAPLFYCFFKTQIL